MGNADTKSPAERRAERFDRLRAKWNGFRSRTSLGHLYDELEDAASRIGALPHRIAELRNRGYRFRSDWEDQVTTLSEGWPERQRQARQLLKEESRRLEEWAREIEELCSHSRLSDRSLDRLESRLDGLQSQISNAERNVHGAFDALNQQVQELQREFDTIEYLLDSLDTASFALYPEEHGVAACAAVWTNHPDEPEGILFLTDGRLVFEQREKKAKKKVLFITTESELVQKQLWEAPVGILAELEAEDKRKLLRHKELLHLRFRDYPSGLHGDVTLQLEHATNEEWASLIKRVQSGEIEAERHGGAAPDAAPPAPAVEVPTKCPACGGDLPPLVKGMQTLVCAYCGTSVRV